MVAYTGGSQYFNERTGQYEGGPNDPNNKEQKGAYIDTDKDGVDDNQPRMGDMSNPEFQFNAGYESSDSNEDDQKAIQEGQSNFGQMRDQFFGNIDKDDTAMRGLQLGTVADQVGKSMDADRSEQQAEFQSGLYKDNSKFGADLEYDFQSKTRADEFGYGMRSMDKQFNLQDEFQNRQFGRNIGTLQATGEQDRKSLKETGAQARESYDFQDTVDARGEERDRGRAISLARRF